MFKLFKKKQNVTLDHTKLAEALVINVDFDMDSMSYLDDYIPNSTTARINEDIQIKIVNYSKLDELETETYVGDVLVNEYEFYYEELITESWVLLDKKIYHPLPDEIIKIINNWALKEIKEKRISDREITEIEEISKNGEKDQLNAIYKKIQGEINGKNIRNDEKR